MAYREPWLHSRIGLRQYSEQGCSDASIHLPSAANVHVVFGIYRCLVGSDGCVAATEGFIGVVAASLESLYTIGLVLGTELMLNMLDAVAQMMGSAKMMVKVDGC